MSGTTSATTARRVELATIWGLLLSLACCLAILVAVEAPLPAGYALCVTSSCPHELVRLPAVGR